MKAIQNAIVITRHAGLVEYLKQEGIIDDTAAVFEHAKPKDIKGKHVIGVLPHSLSCLTKTFSEVPLSLPADMRGKELTVNDVRKYAQPIKTYSVSVLTFSPT